jgi:hypothetical protein
MALPCVCAFIVTSDGNSLGMPERLALNCSGNVQVLFNELIGWPIAIGEDAAEIAYFNADCPWDHFMDEDLARKHGISGLHIGFTSGLVLRIRCDEANAGAI